MKIAYYGHSSFAAEINGKHLLFDPFITQAEGRADLMLIGMDVGPQAAAGSSG